MRKILRKQTFEHELNIGSENNQSGLCSQRIIIELGRDRREQRLICSLVIDDDW